MKKPVLLLSLLLAACGGHEPQNSQKTASPLPAPGEVVAKAEEPVREDTLNHFSYSVVVTADSAVSAGVYDVEATFGPNTASGKMMLPRGGEHFKPVIRKGSDPYTYIIGFKAPGDTTFYDYFKVSSSRTATKMEYIKTYTLN